MVWRQAALSRVRGGFAGQHRVKRADVARGAKLRLTLSWTSTAQNPANLLYLTGVPDGSSLTVKSAYITLPLLKHPISG